jgi:hypothetical protein
VKINPSPRQVQVLKLKGERPKLYCPEQGLHLADLPVPTITSLILAQRHYPSTKSQVKAVDRQLQLVVDTFFSRKVLGLLQFIHLKSEDPFRIKAWPEPQSQIPLIKLRA